MNESVATNSAVQDCVERAMAHAENDLARDREVRLQLQAPLPDALLSWKPIKVWKHGENYFAIYAPYVDDVFLRQRLDDIFGIHGWREEFKDQDKLTLCDLTLEFPSGPSTKEGIAYFKARDNDEGNTEKGSRTLAFRDACKHFGVCGRDIDGAQTRPILVDGYSYAGKDNKEAHAVNAPLESLDRTVLLHSGQSSHALNRYVRPRVPLESAPSDCRYFATEMSVEGGDVDPAASMPAHPPKPDYSNKQQGGSANGGGSRYAGKGGGAKKDRGDFRNRDFEWPMGKNKGTKMRDLEDSFLKWAEEKADFCNPGETEKYDEWLHSAVSHERAQREGGYTHITNEPKPEEGKVSHYGPGGDDEDLDSIFANDDEIPF